MVTETKGGGILTDARELEGVEQSGSGAEIKTWLRKLLTAAADDWRLSERAVIAMCCLPVVVASAGIVSALLGKEAYKWFTGEDRFAESLQVVFYSLALVMSLIMTRRLHKLGEKGTAGLYLLLSLGLFFLIGEELSWGQRMIGWETPESLVAINKQDETNLHNIYGVGSTFKWIQMLVGAYGAFLPIVVIRSRRLGPYRRFLSRVVPHYSLIPFFLPLFVWRLYRNLLEAPPKYYFVISDYNEVLELILALGFFFFVLYQVRRFKVGNASSGTKPEAAGNEA
jgi:hypothetical protein